ncbi:MAG TPA: GNAT family N-acetyltransferase [Roseiflexaceae bacterium]|nr:GNAT family N-acetyltransferase [Roseiflexaceae bacterium]
MTTLSIISRSYVGEADLPAIVAMLKTCETADRLDENITIDDLRLEFAMPEVDIAHDVRLWVDTDGALLGFGQIWFHPKAEDPDSFVWYKVHPDARGGDLDDQIVAWGERRTREAAQERGVRLRYRAMAHASEPERIAFLERSSFVVDRYFQRMARPLDTTVAAPQLPDGFRLVAGPHDPAAWAELFNESFVDHWNHEPWTADKVQLWQSEPHYRPDIDLVAVAPDSTLAAFCWGGLDPEINASSGLQEGHIGLLGSRRGYRGIGLGRAMLFAGLRALAAAGARSASLSVDADSPTGATRLYESAGFRTTLKRMLYGKNLDF